MDRLAKIEREKAALKDELVRLSHEASEIIRRSFITCRECGKKSALSSWTFVQIMYFRSDHWHSSDIATCHIICPKCEGNNYIYNHPQRDIIVSRIQRFPFSPRELFDNIEQRKAW